MNKQDGSRALWLVKMMLLAAVTGLVWAALILLLAGRLDYWQGWVFSAITLVLILVNVYVMRDQQDLINERLKPGPGTKWWDKVFYAFFVPFNIAIIVVGPLDTGRFFWSPPVPAWVYAVGLALYIFSLVIVMSSEQTNRFFSSTVRIQEERGQYVIQEGPYRYVRHPGYVGGILLAFGMALSLGSLWALIPAAGATVAIIVRTSLEDKTLHAELPGYADYAQKVKYRLFPGLW